VRHFVEEFGFDFEVENCGFLTFAEMAMRKCLRESRKVDLYSFVTKVEAERKRGKYLEGQVILIDAEHVDEFVDSGPSVFVMAPNNERGFFGVTDHARGVMLLREFRGEVVRHECGHLFGDLIHHRGRCMQWECIAAEFCETCDRKLRNIARQRSV
jgi:hypothetical protein